MYVLKNVTGPSDQTQRNKRKAGRGISKESEKDESAMYIASGCDVYAKDQYKVMMLSEK